MVWVYVICVSFLSSVSLLTYLTSLLTYLTSLLTCQKWPTRSSRGWVCLDVILPHTHSFFLSLPLSHSRAPTQRQVVVCVWERKIWVATMSRLLQTVLLSRPHIYTSLLTQKRRIWGWVGSFKLYFSHDHIFIRLFWHKRDVYEDE